MTVHLTEPEDLALPSAAIDTTGDGVTSGFVVAGVDDTTCSRHAARWAADHAAALGVDLHLIHAYSIVGTGWGHSYPSQELDHAIRLAGQALLDQLAVELRRSYPGLTVTTVLDHGDPIGALRRHSIGAQVTVVGANGAGRLSAIALGSVALAMASHHTAPVAVVHEAQTRRPDGPVIVGVDTSANSDHALDCAFQWAHAYRTPLVALRVSWHDSLSDALFPTAGSPVDHRTVVQQERELLSEKLRPWRQRYPTVEVHEQVKHGRPVPILVDESARAQLIVVGSRGQGGVAGLLLGSTSHALITRSNCPVVVAGA